MTIPWKKLSSQKQIIAKLYGLSANVMVKKEMHRRKGVGTIEPIHGFHQIIDYPESRYFRMNEFGKFEKIGKFCVDLNLPFYDC